ncbi:Tol-Pal system protein TolB [Frankliniella fusca]|uniref:Tol-Pal system protein TolB n=1 Tax=Frankliniella fusca TaxID=407009 RepID=A0AAE1HNV0_9NEOP|nr:Tol-Pal system protein TolB [Frankliniella fusca]
MHLEVTFSLNPCVPHTRRLLFNSADKYSVNNIRYKMNKQTSKKTVP